ncbi:MULTISPECIES: membrane-bound PQQ-dependent dehydrogenase, glucose/quinate/shikimate family [Hydrocarboniphaga]|uniref:Glucose dehydrogenase n=1 Tax=Hydrocarboniphaga effusa AP103 TaxID=1172194 RepID=I8HXB5_9GAMM|nr:MULTISPECIES: membrane-bound PQQ-dependent dehydrogenase, glucose/quinate/shikimate family [Hydrocarboniphaga]EIT67996.1 glucose dehydrogenase [Hydrocarboniphaga effusa AP103]MDZ4080152.1 membrane-bound PQQ-dependent dehydrogenase, glucose/quinate/shikimate family [Hydrocarboniphaga sp.]
MNFVLGLLVFLVGLAMGVGGVWLLALEGSAYYLPAGLGLMVSGVLLMRRHRAGAWVYWIVLAATAVWSAWESGLDYWRWVPRLGLLLGLGIVVALLAPWLRNGPRLRSAWPLAGVFVIVFIAAFGLAFLPYGVTKGQVVPSASAGQSVISDDAMPGGFAQPATQAAAQDWAAYGGSNQATRYSPLSQITKDNVKQLRRAWTYRTGDLPEHRWGAETTPLKIGDSVYLCTPHNILISLDASTGKQRWRYDPKVPESAIPYTAACRGVSYYVTPPAQAATNTSEASTGPSAENTMLLATPVPAPGQEAQPASATSLAASGEACATRLVSGTLDGRIIEVDARTGLPCTGFGKGGQVDIKEGMGSTPAGYVSINSPPTIVRGVIVTGHQVLDGQRRDAPSGVIKGFDAVTGELRWAWDMTHPDWTGAPPAGETYTRGTPNMWTIASADEQLGYVYLPMGNSAGDYWSSSRTPAESQYATSLVALDVTTGKPVWNFQTTHIDVWDYDLGSQPALIDFPVNDSKVPAVLLPSKQGDVYILDRRTGEPLVGVEERAVPGGGVEPEKRSKTQPFSTYHTLARRDLSEADMWGMTPLDQLVCRIQFRSASYQGIYTPPTSDRHSIEYPGYNGGSDWGGVAIDPNRGVMIANYNDMPNYNRLVPREEADRNGWKPREELPHPDTGGAEGQGDPQAGTPYAIDVNAGWRLKFTKLLCKQPPYGGIRAVDLATGKTLWDRPFGSARGNGPFGIRSGLPIEIGTPNNGGSVVTAGGLIFIAAATDDLIRAIDIETGETVWQDALPAGGQANPMVYEIGGKQYLVIVAAGHHFMETPAGDYVIAYALPG